MDPRELSEPVLQELLSAHAVLPEQFWPPRRGGLRPSGEQALMWAVFVDGLESYFANAAATSVERQREFQEAEEWIHRTDWNFAFSFSNLCEAFGFDPDGLRGDLRRHAVRERCKARHQRFRPATLRAA